MEGEVETQEHYCGHQGDGSSRQRGMLLEWLIHPLTLLMVSLSREIGAMF